MKAVRRVATEEVVSWFDGDEDNRVIPDDCEVVELPEFTMLSFEMETDRRVTGAKAGKIRLRRNTSGKFDILTEEAKAAPTPTSNIAKAIETATQGKTTVDTATLVGALRDAVIEEQGLSPQKKGARKEDFYR